MFKTNDKRSSMSFRSYVGLSDQQENKDVDIALEENFREVLNPRLLKGEAVATTAQNVLMYAPLSEKQGKSGILTVTNFKLSFVTTDERLREERGLQENLLLGENDVCLSNVDEIHQLTGDRRQKILPGKSVSGKVKGLCIICKNMKVIQFSFKFSPVGHGKNVTNALLHHAYPRKHHLLFAYDFKTPYYNCRQTVSTFRDSSDWSKELCRTGAVGWKLSAVNQDFQLSTSLPQCLVVPAALVDCQLIEAARHFRSSRPPVWCWSSRKGAALVRMADLQPTITDSRMLVIQPSVIRHSGLSNIVPEARTQENIMLENVRKGHPQLTQPELLELTQELPSPKDVYVSYCKLRDLCTPENVRQFWTQENHFLSQVENSRWLTTVSACLAKAAKAAKSLRDNVTVVIQEADGRDMSCLISSLTQLLVDTHFRTILGFQTLLQKEWVAMGHPFCSRLGHILNAEIQQSPILLLFLDCVWQLQQQFPTAFEFTETYLTTLWDCSLVTVFDTFLFDCERDRLLASRDPSKPLPLRSLWDWEEQFLEKDISLFRNPLYDPSKEDSLLNLHSSIPNLAFWSQCYFRWIPLLEIKSGGPPQVDLGLRALYAQIHSLQEQLAEVKAGERTTNHIVGPSRSEQRVTSFFPFSASNDPAISPALLSSTLALNNSFASNETLLDTESLLNAPD